jgi:hypothetical protein
MSKKGMAECKQMLSAMSPYSAANVKADPSGKAVFPAVAAGTYYLYSVTQFNNQFVLYNLKVDLKPVGPRPEILISKSKFVPGAQKFALG